MAGRHPQTSSSEDLGDDAANESDEQWQASGQSGQALADGSEPATTQSSTPSAPMQKRRRVTRACDECRRKKIKCDGMQPCTHCTVYSYECTYDQPSNRRRNPTPQYVEAMEQRLQRAEALLRNLVPDVDLDDPHYDTGVPQRMNPRIKQETPPQNPGPNEQGPTTAKPGKTGERSSAPSENLLESMVNKVGSLDLDDQGNWDYHGQSSGLVYLRCLRDQFGDLMGQSEGYGMPFLKTHSIVSPINSPQSSLDSPNRQSSPNTEDLPPRECAVLLCQNALDDACALMRIVHLPTFWAKFNRAYSLHSDEYRDADNKFLPLLYVVLALGTVFAKAERSHLQRWGYENAIHQGFTWFSASRSMVDVTDCRDLTSLQTHLFMILFLQCSSRLSTCYSHIGIVLRSSIRMGLHRSISGNFNPIEQEIRKRIFWVVRKMDIYVAALLGLPMYLNDDDFDQDMPLEIDDEFITSEKILPMPSERLSVMSSFNAHTRLVDILAKTTRYIYPVKGATHSSNQSYAVSHDKVREIERDLQAWMEALPMALRPGGDATPEIERVQQLLRMAYAYTQNFLYRPFLHYISQKSQKKSIDKRSYACAAACVSVSRNIIHISEEMMKKGLLNGSYWFYMYTTFFAILSLVFFVLENPNSSTTPDILRDAFAGRDTLARLARTSMAADKSMQTLKGLFEQLPRKLKGAKSRPTSQKKRQASSIDTEEASNPAPSAVNAPCPVARSPANTSDSPKGRTQSSPTGRQAARPQETSTHLRPQVITPSDPYSPNSASATTSSSARSAYGPNQQYSNILPDMTDIMFPSADPLAYPKQPMMTLEDQNLLRTGNTNIYSPPETPALPRVPYEGFDTQYFTPVPPYLMQFPQDNFGFEQMSTTTEISPMTASSNPMALENPSPAWPPEEMQQLFGQQRAAMNYEYPYGHNWMSQDYNQGQQ